MAVLVSVGLLGCQSTETKKAEILSVNDLNQQFKDFKETLRAKYNGKEVTVLGQATSDFDPDPAQFEPRGFESVSLNGSDSEHSYVGVDCRVEKANADKLAGVKDGDIIAVKGTLYINDGNMELKSCSRDFRGSK